MKYNIEVKLMKDENIDEWDEFVENSENGTIFHLQRFLRYHPKNRFKDYNIMFYRNSELIGVIPGTEKYERGRIFISHPGASFGSIILKKNTSIRKINSIIQSLISHLKENNFDRVIINQAPLPYMNRFYENIDFLYCSNGFNIKKKELSSIIFMNYTNKDDFLKSLIRSTRGSYRKSLKFGLITNESNNAKNIETFYHILKSVKLKYEIKPAHSLFELKKLLKIFPNKIKFFGTFYNNKLIGGVTIFLCNKKIALVFYNVFDRKYQHLKPANYQICYVMEWLWKRGYKYLDFGISTINMQPNFGLIKFKMGFGSHNFVRNQYLLSFEKESRQRKL